MVNKPAIKKNTNLHSAKEAKNDEFYTRLEDIENELKHYKAHFKGKTVLLNCDDPFESNFFNFFALQFNNYQLKKLIAVSYKGSVVANTQQLLPGFETKTPKATKTKNVTPACKIEITKVIDCNGDGAIDMDDVKHLLKYEKKVFTRLKGDGDFRSAESIKLLEEADIVVTNPPFSLFREYMAQLIEHNKKFLIIGNMNAITYKEIFPLIKDNKAWLGVTGFNQGMYFKVTDDFVYADTYKFDKEKDGVKVSRVPGVCWFTNLTHSRRNEEIILYKRYLKKDYPKYDNYDAINVDKVNDIPKNYKGVMGVPITFLDKYNPNQFDLIGLMATTKITKHNFGYPYVNGVKRYARVLIKAKK